MVIKKYWTIFKISLQKKLTYRFSTIVDFVYAIIFFLIGVIIWQYVYQFNTQINGFSLKEVITYYFISVIINTLSSFHQVGDSLTKLVISGDLANFLIKPQKFFLTFMSEKTAKMFFNFFVYSVLGIIILIFFKDNFIFPQNLLTILYFIFSLILFMLSIWLIFALLGCLSFWFVNIQAALSVIRGLIQFLSGAWLPLFFFPSIVQKILYYTPFYYLRNFQLLIYLNKLETSNILIGFLWQVGWIILLSGCLVVVWRRGLRRFESVGI